MALTRWQRLLLRLGGLTESVPAVGIDPDDAAYRPLTSRSPAYLDSWQHDRMLAVAAHLDRVNPIAHRVLDLIVQHVFAEGISISARAEPVGALLQAHWDDPVNRWDARAPRLLRLLLRDGELLLPAGVNPVDGRVTWGTIPAREIAEVEVNPRNWEIATSVTLRSSAGEPPPTLTVIQADPLTDRLTGDALFWRLTDDGIRGISLLYPVADLLDLLERAVFNEAEREQLAKSFIWDVTITGASDDVLRAVSTGTGQFAQPPRPGSNLVHNEAVTVAAVSPDLRLAESVAANRFRLGLILGSLGIPEHWFGMGGDVNRAVGTVMGDPTIKMLTMVQRTIRELLIDALRFVIDSAVERGTLPELVETDDGDQIPARLAFDLVMPDMDPRDMVQSSAALVQATSALTAARAEGLVSTDAARRTLQLLLSQFGIDIDPAAELAALEADAERTAATEQARLAPTPAQQARLDALITPNGSAS